MESIGFWQGTRKIPYLNTLNTGIAGIGNAYRRSSNGTWIIPYLATVYTTKANYDAGDVSLTFNGITKAKADISTGYGVANPSVTCVFLQNWTSNILVGSVFRGLAFGSPTTSQSTGLLGIGASSTLNFYGCSVDGSTGSLINLTIGSGGLASTCDVTTVVNGSTADTRTVTFSAGVYSYSYTVSTGDLGSGVSGLSSIDVTVKNTTASSRGFTVGVSGDSAYTNGNRAGIIDANNTAYRFAALDSVSWDACDFSGARYRSGSATSSGTGTTYAGYSSVSSSDLTTGDQFAYNLATSNANWSTTTGAHNFDVEELCTKWTS